MKFCCSLDAPDADDFVKGACGEYRQHDESERGRVQPDADPDFDGGVLKRDGLLVRKVGARADEYDAWDQRRTEQQAKILLRITPRASKITMSCFRTSTMIHTPKKPPRLIHYASQSAINHTKRETGKFPIVGELNGEMESQGGDR